MGRFTIGLAQSSIWMSTAGDLALLLTGCPQSGDNGAGPTATVAAPTVSALSLSAGLLNPAFDPNVTTYETMFIGNTSVTVTPTAPSGAITVNGTPVTSGAASGSINLPSGNTTITVAVTGTSGTTTYTITAHQLAQQAYVKASNTEANDYFGTSVALSGDSLAVGAYLEAGSGTGVNPADNNSAADSGAVYVLQ